VFKNILAIFGGMGCQVYKRVGSHVFKKWCLALVIIPCTVYMALTMAEYVAKSGYELK